MLSSIGLSSRFDLASASSPHAYQSTGLCACCKRYGLVSLIRRFVCLYSDIRRGVSRLNCSELLWVDYVPRAQDGQPESRERGHLGPPGARQREEEVTTKLKVDAGRKVHG